MKQSNLIFLLVISRVHANQEVAELLARKIVGYGEKVPIGGHESECRPPVTIVANVDVGLLGVVAADRNEISVEQRQVFFVGECLLVHTLAEAAPECGEEKHHRLVVIASEIEWMVAPFVPMNKVCSILNG